MPRSASFSSDVSSISDCEGVTYQTPNTTPARSDSGAEDKDTEEIEDFRDREYPQLKGKIYLDHGGTTIYSKSLMEQFSADMISNLYGNPHSASSPSALSGHRVDAVRERALRFFNADPEKWDLVFTANATASIKLVAECFRDHAAVSNTPVWFGYHRDSHTSVVGVRELAKMHRCFTSDEEVDIWINSGGLGGPRARQLGLFAYPGQSNMTGRRLPLSWPGKIRKTFHKAATYTLLDAAALASTAPLDLSDTSTAPDFVALSFYKIFGFPNIGGLLVQKKVAPVMQSRRYFGGGTVDMVVSINDVWHAKKSSTLHDHLEDGTTPFHSIIALDHAMDVHERLYGANPMNFISMHTSRLVKQLYDGLSQLRHSNGAPMVCFYKDKEAVYGDPTVQGATLALAVLRADGTMVGYSDVENAADDRNIYVRSGSLCNPGGVATYLNWSPAEMRAAFQAGHRCSHPTQLMLGKATGVVRVSLGAMNIAADVTGFINFVSEVYRNSMSEAKTAASMHVAPHTAHQVRIDKVDSVVGTPTKLRAPSLKIYHAMHVPEDQEGRLSSTRPPSVAPTEASQATSAWDLDKTPMPTTNADKSTLSLPLADKSTLNLPLSDSYFPGKLARKGQQLRAVDMQAYKSVESHSLSGLGIKVQEVKQHTHDKDSNVGIVKHKKKSYGLKTFLHRKGSEYAPAEVS